MSISLPESALLAVTQESRCETVKGEELPRDNSYNYKLAIKQSSGWIVCPSNDEINLVHEIKFGSPDNPNNIIFKWAVPKSENNEFIYISSTIGDNHPLSLFRNSAAGELASFIPFHEDKLKQIGRVGYELKQQFIDIHHGSESQPDKKILGYVKKWHDTGLWLTSIGTENLVEAALHSKAQDSNVHFELGAERLIRVKKKRPLVSWIKFISKKPKAYKVLTVTLFYSGDTLESLPKYKFQFREKK